MPDESHKAGRGADDGGTLQKGSVLPNTHLVVPMPPVAPPRPPEQAAPPRPVNTGIDTRRE